MAKSNLLSTISLYAFSGFFLLIALLGILAIRSGADLDSADVLASEMAYTRDFLEKGGAFRAMMERFPHINAKGEKTREKDRLRELFSSWRATSKSLEPQMDQDFVDMGLMLDRVLLASGSFEETEVFRELTARIQAVYDQQANGLIEKMNGSQHRLKRNRFLILSALIVATLWFLLGYPVLSKFVLQPLVNWYNLAFTGKEPQEEIGPSSFQDFKRLDEHLKKVFSVHPKALESLSIVRSMTEGLLVVSPDGIIQRANKSMEQMLGYRNQELVGKPFTDIYVRLKSVHVQGFFKRKTTYREEELFKTREGKIIPVRFSSSFLFDEEMEVIGFICIAKDITKEKHVEEELLKQSEWFKVTLASIGDAVITTNTEGVVTFMNDIAETLTGWTTDEARDVHVNEVFQIIRRVTREALPMPAGKDLGEQTGSFRVHDLILIHRSGKEIPVDKSMAPIRSSDGQLHGAVVVFRDVTELRRVAEELNSAKERAEAAALAKDRFLANLSHEIRTPMNGVIGMTTLLLDSDLTSEQRESAELVRGSAESLLALINDILDFSKIEAGKLELEKIEFKLRTCVEEVGDLLAQKAHEKGLEIPILVGHDVPISLLGDPGRLRQILLNLINNAVKFTEAGEIFVEVRLLEETMDSYLLHCEVVDTGIGISEEKMDRLFKPFSQGDATMSRKYGGTGLGLAICKELTEAMGGRISIKSTQGEGTAFSINLRFGKPKTCGANRITVPAIFQDVRFLVADPHPTNRRILRYYLEEGGGHVGEASLRDEIIPFLVEAAENGKPYQVVLLDYFLAGMDGLLEKLQGYGRAQIILTTSMLHRKDASKATPHLAHDYLTKPVKVGRLYKAIRAVLNPEDPSVAPKPVGTPQGRAWHLKRRLGAPRILVVDDNAVNQKVAVRLLEKQGYRCDVAFNGLQALEALGRISFDLILMDCQMPEMDGFQATQRIRERTDEKKNIPIVAMTANALKGDRERCLDAGMDDYLSKPVNKKALADVLQHYLSPDGDKP